MPQAKGASMQLLNDLMGDGSRNFILLPVGKTPSLHMLLRVLSLWGAVPTAYIPTFAESWIDFRYQGHQFSINDQYGDYWFFVRDPQCPDVILEKVVRHFAKLLDVTL